MAYCAFDGIELIEGRCPVDGRHRRTVDHPSKSAAIWLSSKKKDELVHYRLARARVMVAEANAVDVSRPEAEREGPWAIERVRADPCRPRIALDDGIDGTIETVRSV